MKRQFGLKTLLLAGFMCAILAAVVAPLARRIEISADGCLTVETEPGVYISLVGVELTPAGRVVGVVFLATLAVLTAAWWLRARHRSNRCG